MRKSTSMRRFTGILFFTATAITAMLLASTTAQALSSSISTIVLKGTNGQVDVGEFTFSPTGGYFVDVKDGSSIEVFGFAVSTNDSPANPSTTRPGWDADPISQADWDAGFVIGLDVVEALSTTDIGPFASFFGTDLFANLYHNENYWGAIMGVDLSDTTGNNTDQPFPTNDSTAQFFFGGGPYSHFVAFTSTGGVISQSLPEPSTIVLLGSGLAGIIAWRMRKAKA